ncbi:haloacid dehalogenase type II [Candidatus Halobeggiatoa sp. HSG11]|nr:haloacid dehalogenase type II [Candidatus Halobeggiatoa sp. HSG11]
MATLAFDIYGTLINPYGIAESLQQHIGDKSSVFAQIWRDKQLEYSFRRGLMGKYQNFTVCTRQALDYTCSFLQQDLSESVRDDLMMQYLNLPSFDDVVSGLELVKNHRIYAFSNGVYDDVKQLLENAKIQHFFAGIISVDTIDSFKPDPAVYSHFIKQTHSIVDNTWLISSNPFDVIGARAVDWNAVWLQRDSSAIFDPWEIQPTVTINRLEQLANELDIVS